MVLVIKNRILFSGLIDLILLFKILCVTKKLFVLTHYNDARVYFSQWTCDKYQ